MHWARENDNVKLLILSRNFGHQAAITAGLDHADGDAVVIMDGDLQDPPEVVPQLLEKYCEGYDIVHAKRKSAITGDNRHAGNIAWPISKIDHMI